MYGEGMNERECASMMKGGENPDLTLQWNIVYVILNILRPWYMLLDYLFLKKKNLKKRKTRKTSSSTAGAGPRDVWSWVRQEVITSVKYINPPFCS